MEHLPKLTSQNVHTVLQSLMDEASRPMEEPYDNAYNRARLALLRQRIKIVELFIEHERFSEIESRLERLDGFVSDIKQGMFSDDAAKWIRSKNGVQ